MNTSLLLTYLSRYPIFTDELKKDLLKELTQFSFPKNHLLHEAPRIADHAYFLNKGFALSYTFVEGKKTTEAIWKAGHPMSSFTSFFERVPSMDTIQLVVPSEVLFLSHVSMQRLLERREEARTLYQLIIHRQNEHCQERIHDLQQLSAHDRFQKLLIKFPRVEQWLSQDAIASYLGITPQSLSRIKRQQTKL